MTLIGLLIVLVVVGIILAMVPVDPQVRKWIYVVLVVLFALWLLTAVGVFGDYGYVRIR